jgi:hypothetical protein
MKKNKSGRPIGSEIRQNIVEILECCRKAYGYEIYRYYLDIFPKCTSKSIYYHLKKGLDTGEFVLDRIENKSGQFSWGENVQRKYFRPGPGARALGNKEARRYFEKREKVEKGKAGSEKREK